MESIHKFSYRNHQFIFSEKNDWNEFGNLPSNVQHHIFSLRWLVGVQSDLTGKILMDFVNFHSEMKNKKSPYFRGRIADHTVALRIQSLSLLLKSIFDSGTQSIAIHLLEGDVRSSLSGESYRENPNNHGLQSDLAIISLLKEPKTRWMVSDQTGLVLQRIQKQLEGIFALTGESKEHSISYQEYNFAILVRVKITLESLGILPESIKELYEAAQDSTKKIMGFSMDPILKEVPPIGDTLEINRGRASRSELLGSGDPVVAYAPYSVSKGVMLAPIAGFWCRRSHNSHIVLTASDHSVTHKQDDDLSIWWAVDGNPIIAEAGWHDLVDKSTGNYLKARESHSSPNIGNSEWRKRGGGATKIEAVINHDTVKGVFATSKRPVDGSLSRLLLTSEDFILVYDFGPTGIPIIQSWVQPKEVAVNQKVVFNSNLSRTEVSLFSESANFNDIEYETLKHSLKPEWNVSDIARWSTSAADNVGSSCTVFAKQGVKVPEFQATFRDSLLEVFMEGAKLLAQAVEANAKPSVFAI